MKMQQVVSSDQKRSLVWMTAAFSAVEIDADNPGEDHLCLLKLDGKLLEMCLRPELHLRLAAAMPKSKAVEEL